MKLGLVQMRKYRIPMLSEVRQGCHSCHSARSFVGIDSHRKASPRHLFAGRRSCCVCAVAVSQQLAIQIASQAGTPHDTPATPSGKKPPYAKPTASSRGKKEARLQEGASRQLTRQACANRCLRNAPGRRLPQMRREPEAQARKEKRRRIRFLACASG